VTGICIISKEKFRKSKGINTATGLRRCLMVDLMRIKSHHLDSRINILWIINLSISPANTATTAMMRFLTNNGMG
jgi:hypothetical protein